MTHESLKLMRSFPQSICHQCCGVKYTQSKNGSLFLMCNLTSVRYPRQPLSLCHAFQPAHIMTIELESNEGIKREFMFRIRAELLTHSPIAKANSEVPESVDDLQTKQAEWILDEDVHSEEDTIHFKKSSSASSAFFCFEVNQSLPHVQLCPPGSLFVNQSFRIEWTSTAKRVPVLATLECSHGIEVMNDFEQALSNAYKMTFIQ